MWCRNGRLLRHLFYLLAGTVAALAVHYCLLSVSQQYHRVTYLLLNPRNIVKWAEENFGTQQQIAHLLSSQRITSQALPKSPFPYSLRANTTTIQNKKTHCKPKKNIVFLKVHKCGSSTVQNILFRYGEKFGLDFVMPPKGNYLGNLKNTTFHEKYMIKLPVTTYNILCHHTRFNEQNIAEVMSPDSLYVTILRDPVLMFESIFTYSHYDYVYGIKGSNPIKRLNKFLRAPSHFYTLDQAQEYIGHGKNPMLYDFGLENELKDNQSYIDDMIQKLDNRFDLVMMTEYFHESLILFKELMCWSLDDIVFFPLNSRSNSTNQSSITPAMGKKIRHWNEGDVKLYDHFNQTFWQKVRDFGMKRMRKEVELLKERNEYFFKLCIQEVRNDDKNVWHPHDIFVDTYKVKKEMKEEYPCIAMAKSELLYTAVLRTKIMMKYNLIDVTPIPH